MGRINAGGDFGNAVAQPTDFTGVATPRVAFGDTSPAQRVGQRLEAEGRQKTNDEQQQAEYANRVDLMRLRRAHQEADQKAALQQQARDKADGAIAQAKLLGLRDKLGDGLAEIDRGVMDGTIPKAEAAARWAELSKALIDADLDGVPDAHKEFVRIDTAGLAERLTSRVGDSVRKKDQTDTRAALDQTLEHTERLAQRDPRAARDMAFATLDQLGPAAGLDAATVGKIKQGWVEKTTYTSAFAAVNAAKSSNAALAKVEQGLMANQDIDPQKKAGLLAQVENFKAANEARALRQAQHAEIVAARVQRESDSAFNVLSGWAMSGKMANPEASSGLIAKLTPQAAAAYKAMAAEIPARTAAAMLPLEAQQQQLDQLVTLRNTQGTSQQLEQEIKRREEVLRQARTDYGNDPLRAAQERGILEAPIQPLNMSSLDTVGAGLVQRVQQAATVQTRTGRPVSPLLPEEATRVAEVLNALPPGQRSQRIAQMAGILPPQQMAALAKQMDEKSRPLYLEMALGSTMTASGKVASEWVARGAQAIKDKSIKEDNAVMTGLQASIAKFVPESLPPQWRRDVVDAARLIYLGQQAAGGYSPSAAGAAKVALGGEVIDWNGAPIPVLGGGMSADDFGKRLSNAAPAQVRAQAGDSVYINGRAMPSAEFLTALPSAKLVPVAPGRYGVEAGGSIVTRSDRRPLVLEVR